MALFSNDVFLATELVANNAYSHLYGPGREEALDDGFLNEYHLVRNRENSERAVERAAQTADNRADNRANIRANIRFANRNNTREPADEQADFLWRRIPLGDLPQLRYPARVVADLSRRPTDMNVGQDRRQQAILAQIDMGNDSWPLPREVNVARRTAVPAAPTVLPTPFLPGGDPWPQSIIPIDGDLSLPSRIEYNMELAGLNVEQRDREVPRVTRREQAVRSAREFQRQQRLNQDAWETGFENSAEMEALEAERFSEMQSSREAERLLFSLRAPRAAEAQARMLSREEVAEQSTVARNMYSHVETVRRLQAQTATAPAPTPLPEQQAGDALASNNRRNNSAAAAAAEDFTIYEDVLFAGDWEHLVTFEDSGRLHIPSPPPEVEMNPDDDGIDFDGIVVDIVDNTVDDVINNILNDDNDGNINNNNNNNNDDDDDDDDVGSEFSSDTDDGDSDDDDNSLRTPVAIYLDSFSAPNRPIIEYLLRFWPGLPADAGYRGHGAERHFDQEAYDRDIAASFARVLQEATNHTIFELTLAESEELDRQFERSIAGGVLSMQAESEETRTQTPEM